MRRGVVREGQTEADREGEREANREGWVERQIEREG